MFTVDRRGSTVEVGSKTNDEETKVFAIAKILYYKIIKSCSSILEARQDLSQIPCGKG